MSSFGSLADFFLLCLPGQTYTQSRQERSGLREYVTFLAQHVTSRDAGAERVVVCVKAVTRRNAGATHYSQIVALGMSVRVGGVDAYEVCDEGTLYRYGRELEPLGQRVGAAHNSLVFTLGGGGRLRPLLYA